MSYMSKSELAMRYFEDTPIELATQYLAREIRNTKGLLEALEAVGYKRTSRRLSPKQIDVIYQYLGEP